MPQKKVLDATAFFLDIPLEGELYSTPAVVGELRDACSRCRLEALLATGLVVLAPEREYLQAVFDSAAASGDLSVLSPADCEVLALALQEGAGVVSDDFALQNVARHLGIVVYPLQQRRARKRQWKFRCPGCGKVVEGPGVCPVCGTVPKRTLK
ncbi:MAG: NOB1 family endonuclease [Methanolinea sp.]|nr:NOB1 family endonuclease [Methanolinea sp.]